MATKKKLLQAAAGSAGGGAGGLNVEQVFSTYLYEGNGSAQVIENGINLGQTYGSGSVSMNLDMTLSSASTTEDDDYVSISSNNILNFGTGDFTVEFWAWIKSYPSSQGFADLIGGVYNEFGLGVYNDVLYYGNVEVSNVLSYSYSNYFDKWTHIALSRSNGATNLYLDGTEVVNASDGLNWSSSGGMTFGKYGTRTHGVQGYMSNVRVVKGTGLYTSNFTPSTSDLTAVTGTALLTAQGSDPLVDNSGNNHSITTNGDAKASVFGPFDAADAGEGGLVWVKNRTYSQSHALFDTERGAGDILQSDLTLGEYTGGTDLSSFNSSGFTLGSSSFTAINSTSNDYASWTFRKAPKFFDVVTYTGTGSAQNISHNLGSVPACIITKRTDASENWLTYHRGLDATAPENKYVMLNKTNAVQSASTIWNDTAPTSTHFTVGSANTNTSGGTYVAYLFAHNDGDGDFGSTADQDIIKCGSYTGNDGINSINLGFEAQWVLIKNTSSASNWELFDVMRGMAVGTSSVAASLQPNQANAEYVYPSNAGIYPTANGFEINSSQSNFNASPYNYIYIAIRRGPMAVPESATDVFEVSLQDKNTTSFPVDMMIFKSKTGSDSHVYSRLTGGTKFLEANNTNAEMTSSDYGFDDMEGTQLSGWGTSWPFWNWKRAPNFFDVVAYTGNGTAGRTVSHNLGVAPEMMWVFRRTTTGSKNVYHSALGNQGVLLLTSSNAAITGNGTWNSTSPTDTVFYLSDFGNVNASGEDYIAYLFASLDGVSKVFSVTKSSGSDASVNCGFSAGPRFVLLKRTDSTGDWYVWDSERGIVAGNDPYLLLNSTAAEVTSTDYIDPTSNGFTIVNGGLADGDYIGYAVA